MHRNKFHLFQTIEKKGETRSSSRVHSKNRIEALKKNEENSWALYSQKEFEEILEEELKENEDVEDGDNTGKTTMSTLIYT